QGRLGQVRRSRSAALCLRLDGARRIRPATREGRPLLDSSQRNGNVNARWLALGLTAACAVTAQAQQKMPLPVEDDPTSPQELRSQKAQEPPPSAHTAPPPEISAPTGPASQALVDYNNGEYQKAYDAIKDIDPAKEDDSFVILYAKVLTELKRYDEGEKFL